MNQKLVIIIVALAAILAGCAPSAEYQNGQYSGAYSAYDARGWKPVMGITIANGNITDVQFDSVNAAGALKTQDAAYNQRMGAAAPTTVAKAAPEAAAALIAAQKAPIDAISGATAMVDNFNELAAAILANAVQGNTSPVSIPMDGTYAAETAPDARGYLSQLSLTFQGDKITSVSYDEVKKGENGQVNYRKSEDAAYSERWGNNTATVYAGYAQALIASQDPAAVDAISGATSTGNSFTTLAARILELRGN